MLFALTARLPADVRRYFYAQLAYTVATQTAIRIWGTKSPIYAAIYSVFTLAIIVAMLGILNGKIRSTGWAVLSWAAGVIVMAISLFSIPGPLRYYHVIGLIEGLAITACGTFLLFEAPYTKPRSIYLTLALLWLSLAAFRLCYMLKIGSPVWARMNLFVPVLLCFAAFSWIGFVARFRPE